MAGYKWFSQDGLKTDVFLFYKQVFYIIVCSIMLLLIIYNAYKDKKKLTFSFTLLPLLLYGLFALLSTIFSKYTPFGFTGIYEQFESIFVILGYCISVYYAFLFIKTEDNLRFIFKYLLISIIILSLLGLSQILGHDFIGSDLAKNLILPSKLLGKLDLSFNFGLHRVYLTLYNPNYVGVYVSLLAPILVGMLLAEKSRNKIILYITALIGLLISLLGSQSKTSVISLFFAAVLILILFRKYIFRKSKILISIYGIVVTVILVLFVLNFTKITNTVNTLFNMTKENPTLTDIKTGDDLVITYKGNDIKINLSMANDGMSILMKDGLDKIIPYTMDNGTGEFLINDERFSGLKAALTLYNQILCLKVNIDNKDWIFSNQLGDNSFYYLNVSGKFDKIKKAESALFTGHEMFASSRGYIWSRTIPLLKDNIFGTGADTFVFAFPQQDYVNLYNAGFDGQLITRPHNMYLQMGVQTGVVSLIAFLLFYFIYFVSSIKLYINGTFNNFYSQVGVSIFIGTVAYMISGITNDSTITVAPLFWALIGIGLAINYKLKPNQKQ
ncbi:O-antigen ligase family protein [Anaerocolumna sp. AGMB13025]|uniref:O-antigen ligase family protein n=1 Tax=Anaerocolumna sp. AGMB13025 TaxID=3039116 RepID=UPI00241C1C3E|nr:O-antigen ligase family protein [Anaerocolumna sp. AGMB13025]WFR56326.1 O-antigen ligase family protein [Anaerocolumna sp. AGMB13025]